MSDDEDPLGGGVLNFDAANYDSLHMREGDEDGLDVIGEHEDAAMEDVPVGA